MSIYIYLHRIQYKHDICIKYISQKKTKTADPTSHTIPPTHQPSKFPTSSTPPTWKSCPPPPRNQTSSSHHLLGISHYVVHHDPTPTRHQPGVVFGVGWMDGSTCWCHRVICCTLGVPLEGVFWGGGFGMEFFATKKN